MRIFNLDRIGTLPGGVAQARRSRIEEQVTNADGEVVAVRMNRAAWTAKHRDYKAGRFGRDARVLTLDRKLGTVSVPVEVMS